MNKGIENPSREKEAPKMGKRERVFTDEEVPLVRQLVGASVRYLRNKEISVHHPKFQEWKREAINVVFGANNITSKEDQDKFWPSLAARIELTMKIPPSEHFQKKNLKKLKVALSDPVDERMQELLCMARENLSLISEKSKVDAAKIRDAVYRTISLIQYPDKKSKEAEAKVLKYHLGVENGIMPSDLNLRRISDPTRQKDLFAA